MTRYTREGNNRARGLYESFTVRYFIDYFFFFFFFFLFASSPMRDAIRNVEQDFRGVISS